MLNLEVRFIFWCSNTLIVLQCDYAVVRHQGWLRAHSRCSWRKRWYDLSGRRLLWLKNPRERVTVSHICCNLVIQKLLLLLFTSANGYTRMYSFSFFSSLFFSLSLSKKPKPVHLRVNSLIFINQTGVGLLKTLLLLHDEE